MNPGAVQDVLSLGLTLLVPLSVVLGVSGKIGASRVSAGIAMVMSVGGLHLAPQATFLWAVIIVLCGAYLFAIRGIRSQPA